MAHALIVMPDDSSKPILDAINDATRSLRVKMFVFSDPALLRATIAAKRRGVKYVSCSTPSAAAANATTKRREGL